MLTLTNGYSQTLRVFEASLKAYLLASRVLHFDETGMRCEKKLHWVHAASFQKAALYTMHKKRGQEAEALPSEILMQIEQNYQQILTEGFAYHSPLPPLPDGKRGKQKQRAGKNLLDRLEEKRDCVLRFFTIFPFLLQINQGEQDIRMVKLKQKISGCFRAFKGGGIFCRIRSCISTVRKQGWNIWEALSDAIQGNPRLLAIDQQSISKITHTAAA